MNRKITDKEIYKNITKLMKDYFLIYQERYFYADEWGIFMPPRFILSPVKIKNSNFDYVWIMNSKHILNYIGGRFICWHVAWYNVGDWLNKWLFVHYKDVGNSE